jgi:hypothetical protein
MRLMPDRTTLFKVLADGRIANHVRMNLSNRSPKPVQIRIWVEGLAGVQVGLEHNPLTLAAGQTIEQTFDITAPLGPEAKEMTPVRVVIQSSDQGVSDGADMMFFMPAKGN